MFFLVWLFVFSHTDDKEITVDVLMMSILFTGATWLFIYLFTGDKGPFGNVLDLLANLESDPKKFKARMLVVMRHGHHKGIKGALEEFNDIFRKYPQLHLQN